MWKGTTRAFVCSQINQRISPQTGTLKPDLIRFTGCQENVLFWLKKQSFPRLLCHWQTVLWTQTQNTPLPISFVPTQQFKLQRFCFFGQDGHLWESKLRVTLQVRPGWDTRGGSELSEGPTSKGGRRSFESGILSPHQRAAFLTPAVMLKDRGRLSFSFCHLRIKTATWCCHCWVHGDDISRVSPLPPRPPLPRRCCHNSD